MVFKRLVGRGRDKKKGQGAKRNRSPPQNRVGRGGREQNKQEELAKSGRSQTLGARQHRKEKHVVGSEIGYYRVNKEREEETKRFSTAPGSRRGEASKGKNKNDPCNPENYHQKKNGRVAGFRTRKEGE